MNARVVQWSAPFLFLRQGNPFIYPYMCRITRFLKGPIPSISFTACTIFYLLTLTDFLFANAAHGVSNNVVVSRA